MAETESVRRARRLRSHLMDTTDARAAASPKGKRDVRLTLRGNHETAPQHVQRVADRHGLDVTQVTSAVNGFGEHETIFKIN